MEQSVDTAKLDALLTAAIREAIREDWEAMTQAPDIQPLSQKCSDRMAKILAGEKKKSSRVKRIGIGILVALTAFALIGMAIPPVRETVINTIITWYDTNFGVRYEVETEEQIPTVIEEVILPEWLPDGWTMETIMSNIVGVSHVLSDGRGNRIFMEQYPIDPDNETSWFDNTDITIETITLNGTIEAKLFSYADGSCTLTWADKYVFNLIWSSENADAGVLLLIAESMR